MKNVLVLAAGRRVELVLALKDDLRGRLPGARVLASDIRPDRAAACHVADDAVASPRVADAGYLSWLSTLCAERDIGLVIPTIDTELQMLADARAEFETRGVALAVSAPETVRDCRDKRRTARLFASVGIDTPEIYDRKAIRYPAFAKPYDGSRSIGAARLETPAHLTDDMRRNDRLIFMEFIGPDHHEVTVDAYYDRSGTLRCLVPRQRLEVRDGEVSKGVTRRGAVYDYLATRLRRLQGMRGCITLQVFAHPGTGRVLGIEINPRFGGGFPLSHAAGARYGGWLIDEYLLGRSVAWFDGWMADLLMLRYDAQVLVEGAVG